MGSEGEGCGIVELDAAGPAREPTAEECTAADMFEADGDIMPA